MGARERDGDAEGPRTRTRGRRRGPCRVHRGLGDSTQHEARIPASPRHAHGHGGRATLMRQWKAAVVAAAAVVQHEALTDSRVERAHNRAAAHDQERCGAARAAGRRDPRDAAADAASECERHIEGRLNDDRLIVERARAHEMQRRLPRPRARRTSGSGTSPRRHSGIRLEPQARRDRPQRLRTHGAVGRADRAARLGAECGFERGALVTRREGSQLRAAHARARRAAAATTTTRGAAAGTRGHRALGRRR